jgi:hypothetical protein
MRNEFEEFINGEEINPPKAISEKIILNVKRDLNPSGLSVFKKLTLVQFVTGIITLLFCPQFGIGLTGSMGLMGLLMKFGDNICMAGCGAVFLGMSALFAALLLKPEEVRALEKNSLLQFSSLTLATAGIFICFGAPVLTTIGLSWFAGSLTGGLLTFKLGERLRFSNFIVFGSTGSR